MPERGRVSPITVPLLTQVLPLPFLGLGLAFFDTRAIKSSILERNNFKIGDAFILL